MIDFLSAAFSFPTVLWTVPLVLALAYWTLVMLGALDLDVLDAIDLGGEGELDAEGASGGGFLAAVGLVGVPLTVSLSILALVGWGLTFAAVELLPRMGFGWLVDRVWGGLLLVAAVAVVALALTAFAVRPLRPLMTTRLATEHEELIGHYCTITTLGVDERFGQAEVTDHEGATLLVQVRAATPNALRRGARGLLFDYDPASGSFQVAAAEGTHLDPATVLEGAAAEPRRVVASTPRLPQ